jgi:hypothetical protein
MELRSACRQMLEHRISFGLTRVGSVVKRPALEGEAGAWKVGARRVFDAPDKDHSGGLCRTASSCAISDGRSSARVAQRLPPPPRPHR